MPTLTEEDDTCKKRFKVFGYCYTCNRPKGHTGDHELTELDEAIRDQEDAARMLRAAGDPTSAKIAGVITGRLDDLKKSAEFWGRAAGRASVRADRLAEALRKYGRHDAECLWLGNAFVPSGLRCTCGYLAALSGEKP